MEALLPRIGQQSRHQQARLVEALRRIGPAVTESIVQLGATRPGGAPAPRRGAGAGGRDGRRETLLDWTTDAEPTVRAAAWRAIGVTGMDDRAAYHALRAMTDPDARVRAHAAQALGRTGRTDFVPYLASAPRRRVGGGGAGGDGRCGCWGRAAMRRCGRARIGAGGLGLELARQFLWERRRPEGHGVAAALQASTSSSCSTS